MDNEAAVTMMEAIPPFDWSEVALKKDIEASLSAAFAIARAETNEAIGKSTLALQKEIQASSNRLVTWMIAMNSATLALVAAMIIFAK